MNELEAMLILKRVIKDEEGREYMRGKGYRIQTK